MTRATLLTELEEARGAHMGNPAADEARFAFAELLYKSGEFWQAEQVVRPLVESAEPTLPSLMLGARLRYLIGDYDGAIPVYEKLIAATEGDLQNQVGAQVGLLFAYYQQDRFVKSKSIEFPEGVQLPNAVQMGAFEKDPYELEWHGDDPVAMVPFVVSDPLPVLTIEVNGVPVHVLFDTGGDQLILDDEVAAGLGIESVASVMGSFGGGLQAEIGFGQVERVGLGEVTMHRVPVMILPTKRFSSAFGEGRWPIGGIIGTAAMRQFLGTLDYDNDRLVLRERSESTNRRLRTELGEQMIEEVPFALSATHAMMARGSLNGREGLTFFVDSGLASEAVLGAPRQTLEYLGIPEPETTVDDSGIGGGGGNFASGFFEIESIGMGALMQEDVKGAFGAVAPDTYWTHGFIQDGLISHRFLRQYGSWTLDFDNMTYWFTKPTGS